MKRYNTIMGTPYFISRFAAIQYYKPYNYEDTAAAVDRKIKEGDIHIGKPSSDIYGLGGRVVLNRTEGRYFIEITEEEVYENGRTEENN